MLELIASSLLKYETLTKEQIDYIAEYGKMPTDDDMIEEVNDEVQEEISKKEHKKKKEKSSE